MATHSQKIKLGFFLIITTALFLLVLLIFAGLSIFKAEKKQYILYSQSVSGLQVGAKIKLNGVDIGSVTKISNSLENVQNVRVDVVVKENAPIKKDSKAFLILQGITGLKYIDIRDGTEQSPNLPPNAAINAGEDSLAKVMNNMGIYADKIEHILTNLEKLTGGENRDSITNALKNLDSTLASINTMAAQIAHVTELIHHHLKDNPKSVGQFISNLGKISSNLNQSIYSANQLISHVDHKLSNLNLTSMVNGISDTTHHIQTVLKEVEREKTIPQLVATIVTARKTLNEIANISAENKKQIETAMQNLRQASDSVKEFAKTIEEKPNSLLFGNTPKPREIP